MASYNELISIVIPLYNAEKYIMNAITSVQNQTYTKWELIIVDDGSTDQSFSIVKNLQINNLILIRNDQNMGAAYSRNIGIKIARGRYLAFLDADDIWHPQKLEKQYEFTAKNNYLFTFTGYEYATEDGKGNGKIVNIPSMLTYKQALCNTTISTITVMLDMKYLSKELIIMPEAASREDTATWWKILKTGVNAYGLDETLSYYRRYRHTNSSNKIKAIIGTWSIYRKQEKLSIIKSSYCFICYLLNAIQRRT